MMRRLAVAGGAVTFDLSEGKTVLLAKEDTNSLELR